MSDRVQENAPPVTRSHKRRWERFPLDEQIYSHLGQRIESLRKSAGLTQTRLAERIGSTFQNIQKYETSYTRIPLSVLLKISGALNVPLSDFFKGLEGPLENLHSSPDAESLKQALAHASVEAQNGGFSMVELMTILLASEKNKTRSD